VRKPVRIFAVVAVGLVIVAAVAWFGLGAYLNSGSARGIAAAQFRERLGSEVRVEELSTGAGSTSIRFALPGRDADTPLVTGTVRLNASVFGLATGKTPDVVTLEAATATLHLDRDGKILDPLPQPPPGKGGKLPEIRVADAKVHVIQDGRPDFRLAGVNATLTEVDGKLAIRGTVTDPEYGTWTLTGDWGTDGKAGTIDAVTGGEVRLTPEKLRAIPMVPATTWEAVELDGRAVVRVKLGRATDGEWSWRVEFDATGTHVLVAAAELDLVDCAANVVIDGAKVAIKGFKGTTAGGTVTAESAMDFGPTPASLKFDLRAAGLDVKRTPAIWGLAAQVDEGKLNGTGAITLLIDSAGKVKPTGDGRAKIVGKLLGGGVEVEVFLRGDGERLRFDGPPVAAKPAEAMDLLARTALLLLQAPPAPPAAPIPPAPLPAKTPAPTQYVRANLKLTDVDIPDLLARAKVSSSAKLAGKISLEVSAEIPTNSPGTLKLYRATGKASTPSLQIEGLTLKDVTADVQLADGVLTLSRFSANFPPDATGKPGGFVGTAKFGIEPRTELVADLTLTDLPLGQLVAAVPGYADKADGRVSGRFDFKLPGDKLGDLSAIVAGGTLTSSGLTVFGQKADRVAIDVALKDGVAKLTKADVDIYDGTITGEATVPVVGDKPGAFRVGFKDVNAAKLTAAIPQSPVSVQGKVGGKFAGTIPPVRNFDATKLTGDLDLAAPQLVVQGIPTSKLAGKVGYKPGAITYDLKADALGGNVAVDGTYPLSGDAPADNDVPAGGTLRLDRLRLDTLGRALNVRSLEPLRGVVTLSLKYGFSPDGPTGAGRVEVRGLGWGDDLFAASNVASEIRLTPQGVEVPTLSGLFAGGRLRGRVRYDFDEPRRSVATLVLEDADAAELAGPLGLDNVSGRVSATFRTALGRQLRGGGTVTASRAKFSGIEVSELRLPYRYTYAPNAGVEFLMRDGAGTVAGGRLTARVEVQANRAATVEGRVEFVDVNVSALAAGFNSSSYGVGKTTGRFDFSGAEVKSRKDLNGTLTARFGQTTVSELPVLGSIGPLLSPVQALTRFDSGELLARLGAGRFRLERLVLAGTGAKLFADGTVGLDGRLDLGVVYNTNQIGPISPAFRLIARNIPAIGPVPVGLIVRVTEALSNRVVRLSVGGTTSRPAVSLNAAGLLTENAVRFFVGQYVPLPPVGP